MKLLTYGAASPKLIKSDQSGKGYLSAIMYLLPHKLSGKNVCPFASKGCSSTCLNWAGRGRMNSVQKARMNRTLLYHTNPDDFYVQLCTEIKSFINHCANKKQKPTIRLNGTSDLPWHTIFPILHAKFNDCQFYDYTKVPKVIFDYIDGISPQNLHLTFSRSEDNEDICKKVLAEQVNISVVFRSKEFPNEYWGYPTFSMDETDLRFLDPFGVGCLYAKGLAKKDKTGFVI